MTDIRKTIEHLKELVKELEERAARVEKAKTERDALVGYLAHSELCPYPCPHNEGTCDWSCPHSEGTCDRCWFKWAEQEASNTGKS